MSTIFFRTLIIFITLMVVLRLMGKRQIGEMQPFEFVVTLIIADLACIPMADVAIPLIYGLVAILTLFVLHQLFSLLENKNNLLKFIISGKPSVVIDKNGVNIIELKKNNLDVADLIEALRGQGYFSLDDVHYAIFESNGKLSTLEKEDYLKNPPSIPTVLINDGKLNKTNLALNNIEESFLKEVLAKNQTKLSLVEVMTVDKNKKVYLKSKNKPYFTFNLGELYA
ncbi:MAG: DUF421 domain-containing protein [Clostridiales bacterium]|nr:DUF421 domain-containing protein [Clostridiales bacterium]